MGIANGLCEPEMRTGVTHVHTCALCSCSIVPLGPTYKHKFKGQIVRNLKMAIMEHGITSEAL